MSRSHPTSPQWAVKPGSLDDPGTYLPGIPPGFDAGDIVMPATPTSRPPEERCWLAAIIVHAIAYGATPEDLAVGISPHLTASFLDPLAREEALAHVDLLLGVLNVRHDPAAT